MPRPRVPKAKAKATGQAVKHAADRFNDRNEPTNLAPLGDPPDSFTAVQIKAWNQFKKELFWLNDSHRALLEIASKIRARILYPQADEEEVGIQAMNLLRQCLGSMGATPADASKVNIPDGEGPKDPADKYFSK